MDERRWMARQSRDETAWGICVEGAEAKPDWVIWPTKMLSVQDAALIMAAHNAAVAKLGKENSIEVRSITNQRYEPIVEIVLGAEVAHFQIREAFQFAKQFDEVIEGAQSDALLCRFIRDYVFHGEDSDKCKHAIGHMLNMFREMRNAFHDPVIEAGEKDQ
jgi:hypothetical protein